MRQIAAFVIPCLLLLSSATRATAQVDSGPPIHGRSDVVRFEDFASDDTLVAAFSEVAEAQDAFRRANLRAKELVEPALAAFEAQPTVRNEFLLYAENAKVIQYQDTALGTKGNALNSLRSAISRYRQALASATDVIQHQMGDVEQVHANATQNETTAAGTIREVIPLLSHFAESGDTDDLDPGLVSALRMLDEIARWEGAIAEQAEGERMQIRRDDAQLGAITDHFERVDQEIVEEIAKIDIQRRFLAHQAEMQVRYIQRRRPIAGSEDILARLDKVLNRAKTDGPPLLTTLPHGPSSSYSAPERNNREFLADLLRNYGDDRTNENTDAAVVARGPTEAENNNE